jgi:PEP-CTERM motif
MVGDNSTVLGDVIDPLESASVTIPGPVTATLEIATRLGLNTGNSAVFFSRSSSLGGSDLFDFLLSPSDAAAFNFQAGYGPVTGTDVFALNQFQNVSTNQGALTFNTSGDVQFWSSGASVIPEPSTWTMMLAGFAGLGFVGYRASRKNVAVGA